MLRIHFTPDDIARTRLASSSDPLWETVLSLHVLRTRGADSVHGLWRRSVSAELRDGAPVPGLRVLFELNPPTGYFPDFLTPLAGAEGLEAGLDALASTPRANLRRDVAVLAEERSVPAEVMALADGGRTALRELTTAMRMFHEIALGPHWSHIEAVVERDRARRIRAVAARGAEGLLESFRPQMRWTGTQLEVDYPFEQEMRLAGRGLVFVPSYFCWRYPVTLLDPDLPPVLVYPAAERPETPIGTSRQALAALLGSTRAAALAAVGDGCSTTDLARRVGVSAAAASQHASVLRNAGLVSSHREGNTMLHTVTPLGLSVLNGR